MAGRSFRGASAAAGAAIHPSLGFFRARVFVFNRLLDIDPRLSFLARMLLPARGLVVVVIIAGTAIGGALIEGHWRRAPQVSRAFIPGPLGREVGRPDSTDASRGFRTRAFSGLEQRREQAWSRANGLTESMNFSHNLGNVFPPELFEQHPEFFPLEDGVRVRPPPGTHHWNPDIARPDAAVFAGQAARRFFEANPGTESFALGTNDGVEWGESPELLAHVTPTRWFRERPDFSSVVFAFLNRAAEEVSRTHPQKYLGGLAYEWAENVPPFPLHPQVVPFLTADRAQGYDAEFWREELGQLSKWGAHPRAPAPKGAVFPEPRMGLYDYLYGTGFLIPRIHTRLLAEHLRQARAAGFTDYYAEVYPNWGLDGPMPWLAAQLARDPTQSREALLGEFYARYFREAAGPMRRFFERCEELWMAQPPPAYWLKYFRNDAQAGLFPPQVCAELRASLSAAANAAATPTTRARVALVSATFGVTERLSAFHVARVRLARAVLEEAPTDAIVAAIQAYVSRRKDFATYGQALTVQEPLALHPVSWSVYLRNDPLPAALLAVLAAGRKDVTFEADLEAKALWYSLAEPARGWDERLTNPELAGELRPARTVAGLSYGMSLPAPWESRVEPAERHRASLKRTPEGMVVRIEGAANTHVSQRVPIATHWVHQASVQLRGSVSPGCSASLIVSFIDATGRFTTSKSFRLPEGGWREWVSLKLAVLPPPDAVRMFVSLRVLNQNVGDWIEARNFSLVMPARQ